MKRFVFGLPRVWVALLAFLLVGFLCAPCLVSAATSIDVSSVTNRYFNDYADFEVFRQSQLIQVDDSLDSIRSEKQEISRVRSRLFSITNDLHLISEEGYEGYSLWFQNGQAIDGDHASDYMTGQNLIWNSLNRASSTLARAEYALSSLDRLDSSSTAVSNDLVAVRSALTSPSLPTYQIVVHPSGSTSTNFYYTSVTNIYVDGGGGGCSCPDYTGILNSIYARMSLEITYLRDIDTYVKDLYYVIPNFILGIEETLVGSTDWSDLTNSGIDAGNRIGEILSNSWDYVYYANLYPQIGNGIFSDTPVSQGPAFLREMWNYILRPIAQTWSDYDYATDNRMISGFRDFYIGQHCVAPTNVISNPLWVQFTNSVTLSPSTLAALTNYTPLVNQFMDRLTNSVLTVQILQSSYDEQLETEKEKTEEAAEEASDDASDPDADTVDLPTVDISRVSSVGTSVSRVFTSYAEMFDSIPNELPDYVMLHEGWNLGSVEIPSMYWDLHEQNAITNMLTLLRGLFSSLWFVLYVVVVWSAMAIDLFCAGVCIYCVYGLLLGKPETTVKGIRSMFNLLCSLLGRDPPSK